MTDDRRPDSVLSPALSRRLFLRTAATSAAVLGVPLWTEAHLAMAQSPTPARRMGRSLTGVHIDANENPLGPCEAACEAISKIAPTGGRYAFPLTMELVNTIAETEGLKPESILPYAGSSEPLHYTVMAYTGQDRGLVTADPSYEAPVRAAEIRQAKVTKVALTKSYAHDVRAMVAADPAAGVIYICNPNNPTGTVTSKADLDWALANKPKGSILLIDEAYIHLSDTTPSLDMVKAEKDVIVLRTFSKLYGMAGIRCGFAAGRPDLLEKLHAYGQNSMPITALVAATASLKEPGLIAKRKKINADIRQSTFEWLSTNNYSFIPSESNCFMVDTGRPGREVMAAMAKDDVYIGRVWPVWPSYVRITVGTQADMEAFKKSFKKVMDSTTAGLVPEELPTRLALHPYTHLS